MAGAGGDKDTRRTWPTESTNQGSQSLKWQLQGPAWICPRSSVYMLWLSAWHFSGTPNCGSRCVSDSFFLLLGLFLLLGCLVQLLCEGLCFCIIVFYFVVLGYCFLETCFFFSEGKQVVNLGKRDSDRKLGGEDRG